MAENCFKDRSGQTICVAESLYETIRRNVRPESKSDDYKNKVTTEFFTHLAGVKEGKSFEPPKTENSAQVLIDAYSSAAPMYKVEPNPYLVDKTKRILEDKRTFEEKIADVGRTVATVTGLGKLTAPKAIIEAGREVESNVSTNRKGFVSRPIKSDLRKKSTYSQPKTESMSPTVRLPTEPGGTVIDTITVYPTKPNQNTKQQGQSNEQKDNSTTNTQLCTRTKRKRGGHVTICGQQQNNDRRDR